MSLDDACERLIPSGVLSFLFTTVTDKYAGPTAMSDAPILLTDEEMQRFIREGYITLKSTLPRSYHDDMCGRLEPLDEQLGAGHNNILPVVPQLRDLLDDPAVHGALLSILGPDYYLHFHRHDQVNFPQSVQAIEPWHLGDGRLHKDGDYHSHHMVDGRRHHATRFLMMFYYPQDVSLEMGPTGVAPRSQYFPRRALEMQRADLRTRMGTLRKRIEAQAQGSIDSDPDARARYERELAAFRVEHAKLFEEIEALDAPWQATRIPIIADAGSVTIVHHDIAHGRFGMNTTSVLRHMVKFLFTRDQEPTAPTWDNRSPEWIASGDPQEPIWEYVWNWYRGAATQGINRAVDDTDALVKTLRSVDDAEAIGAAYTLGNIGAIEPLLEALTSPDVALRCIAGYGFTPLGSAAVAPLLDLVDGARPELLAAIADILGDIGPDAVDAVPALTRLLQDKDPRVRQYAAEAIGMVAQASAEAPAELVDALGDDDALVRQYAAVSVARLGARAGSLPGVVGALKENLVHGHHHVRGWSIEALRRLGTLEALDAAFDYLITTRWDCAPWSGEPWEYDLKRAPTRDRHLLLNSWDP